MVPDHRAGKKGRCPTCNLKVFIPSGEALRPEGENGQPLLSGPGHMVQVDPLPNAAIGFDDAVTFQEALAGRPPVNPTLVGMENVQAAPQQPVAPAQPQQAPQPQQDPELGIMPLEPTRPAFPYQQHQPQQPGAPFQQYPPPGQQPPGGHQ